MVSKKNILFIATVMAYCFLPTTSALSQTRSQVYGNSLTQQTMTAYVQADFAANTYESDAAGSKESNVASTWSIGTYAGEARRVGFKFQSSENNVPFELNGSNLKANWRDSSMEWRLWFLYPSVSIGLSEVSVSSTEAASYEIFAPSLGAGLGVHIPIIDKAIFHASMAGHNTPNAWDKSGQDVELGTRVEQDIGASIDLTKDMIDLIVGYRTRSYSVKWNGETFNEKSQGAYTGVRVGLYF